MRTFTFTYGAPTDRGDIRTENQDSVLTLTGTVKTQPTALMIIADGLGGLSYGAEVSRYIIEQFKRWWYEDFPSMIQEGMDTEEDIQELLEQEIWDINHSVVDFRNKMQCRSGSTLSLLLLYKRKYYIENIGDSRIYLMRDGSLSQLTQDQSLATQIAKKHQIETEGVSYSKAKNILTMCIGMSPIPQSNYSSGKLCSGDCFLICSDGLYNPLEIRQMESVLGEKKIPAIQKAECLRKMISKGKARDNVSAIVVEIN